MENVWDLPMDITHLDVLDIIERLEDSDSNAAMCLRFDLAQALYWHCADWHGGMSSCRYQILSTLGYSPGMSESGPDSEASQYIYDLLDQNTRAQSDTRRFMRYERLGG